MTWKITWMAEDGEVSYSEVEDSPPAIGDTEEFDVVTASWRQVVKVVDEEGTVPGAPAPDPVVVPDTPEQADPNATYESWSEDQLAAELTSRGLDPTGTPDEQMTRLEKDDAAKAEPGAGPPTPTFPPLVPPSTETPPSSTGA